MLFNRDKKKFIKIKAIFLVGGTLHLAKEFKEKSLDSGDHTGGERDYSVCTDPKCLCPFPKALDHETMLLPHCHKQVQAH